MLLTHNVSCLSKSPAKARARETRDGDRKFPRIVQKGPESWEMAFPEMPGQVSFEMRGLLDTGRLDGPGVYCPCPQRGPRRVQKSVRPPSWRTILFSHKGLGHFMGEQDDLAPEIGLCHQIDRSGSLPASQSSENGPFFVPEVSLVSGRVSGNHPSAVRHRTMLNRQKCGNLLTVSRIAVLNGSWMSFLTLRGD